MDMDPFGPDPGDPIAAWQTDPARKPGDVLPAHLDYRTSDPFARPPAKPVRKKRPGTIALAAARTMTVATFGMTEAQVQAYVDSIHRWLDNGHSLDTADVEWLAAVATGTLGAVAPFAPRIEAERENGRPPAPGA